MKFDKKVMAEGLAPKFKGKNWFEAFKKLYKENGPTHPADLSGNVDDEADDVDATLQILNQILMGMEGYSDLRFARKYDTTSATFKIPVAEYGAAVGVMAAGIVPPSPKAVDYVSLELDAVEGAQVTWSSAYLEDASFEVMSEMVQGVGHDIQSYLCEKLVDLLEAIPEGNIAGSTFVITGSTVGYDDFLAACAAVDIEGYGPADLVLVNPTAYWQLLADDKFISTAVIGTSEALRNGTIQTTLGVNVIKVDEVNVPIIALNSKKAIALVTRREVTVEVIDKPEVDTYGFTCKFRKKAKVMFPGAVALGSVS